MKNPLTRDQFVLESLNECAGAFLKSNDFENAAHVVYQTCKKLIGATAGYVALLSDDESLNELLFLDMGDLPCDLDPELPMPIRGLREVAYSSKEIIYDNDFSKSEWQKYLPEGHGRLDNVLLAPLIIDDKSVGIFGFANKAGGFHDDDVLVVKAFAELTAMGLLKSRTMVNLETNVKHFNALVQTANDAIITVDQQGLICFWNPAAEKCFGYSAEEIIGKPCTCIVPEKYVHAHGDAFNKAVQTGTLSLAGHQVEVEGRKKKGEIFPVELTLSQWEIDEGVFFTGIVRDISSRRQMEEDVRGSENRLREIFKLMKGGGGVYKAVDDGMDFIIIEFHKPPDQQLPEDVHNNLAGRRILDVFPASNESGLLEVFRRVWKTGKPEYHSITIYEDAEIKGWQTNYVYRLSNGEIVALYEDITERKRMENELVESENLFRSIFDTCPDPINLNRMGDGKFIQVNQKFLGLTGYGRNEVIGRTAVEINLWNDFSKRTQFFEQLIEKWQVNDFEAEFRRKDGKIITALVSAKLLSYKNEPHVLSVSQDITELKKVEQELRKAHAELEKRYEISSERLKESEVKYTSLVDALLTGVYMCVEERIVFVNSQFKEMFGYRKDELLGMSIMDLIHPEDRGGSWPICGISAPGDNPEEGYEIKGVKKNGDVICLMGKNTSVNFNGKEAVLGNIANITRRKKDEEKRRRSDDELRILSAQLLSAEEGERKRIARDIHDSIGQVLSAIKFSVENSLLSIGEQSFPSAQLSLEKIIPLIRQSIDEVRRIIMDLRPSSLDDLGLKATVTWFCREFESIYTDMHVVKELQFEEKDIPVPMKTVIYRILQEALNNAAKYSGSDQIHFSITKTSEKLEMRIEDNGSGFQLDEVLSRTGEERGMGLSSMRERTNLSGGNFDIRSIPDGGTTIHASWPVARLHPPSD